jgi:hypothetical protein
MINQSLQINLCEYRGFSDSVKKLLDNSATAGDDICIIVAQGMMFPKLYKFITKAVDYLKANPDFFVLGHIMAREDRYPGLHRQLLVVNVNTWKQLGSPEYLEQGYFWDRKPEYPLYTLSEKTISADYTPAWIKTNVGTIKPTVVEEGANWIALALKNNIQIDNFDFEMRECKAFLYPYDNPDLLETVWKNLQDEESVDNIQNYTQRAWIRKLAYQEFIEKIHFDEVVVDVFTEAKIFGEGGIGEQNSNDQQHEEVPLAFGVVLQENNLRVQSHVWHDGCKAFANDAYVMAVLAVAWAWRAGPDKVKLGVVLFQIRNGVAHDYVVLWVKL